MPKYGIHNIVLEETKGRLLADSSSLVQQAGLEIYQNKEIAMLGAVGPDLFFWAPDYEVVKIVKGFYTEIKNVVDLYNDVTKPIRDVHDAVVGAADEIVSALAPRTVDLIRETVENLEKTANLFYRTIDTKILESIIGGATGASLFAGLPNASQVFFNYFKPPLQDRAKEKDWYWFDMLHYRNTGDFANNLLHLATTPQQRAFAYGYISHNATDVLGHPFVNQIVGGPFRLHVQRHVTVENFMDTRIFNERFGVSINQTLQERLSLPQSLPSDIGDLIHKALETTYSNVPHPDFLSRGQIDETVENFNIVLNIMKDMRVERPVEPFSGVFDILKELFEDLFEAPPSGPTISGGMCSFEDIFSFGTNQSSRKCYDDFFKNIEKVLDHIGNVVKWLGETLLDVLDALLTLLLTLPVLVVQALLYLAQLLMYEIYQSSRSALALVGLTYPEPEDVRTSYGRNLTTTFNDPPPDPFSYPRQKDLAISHLVYPPAVLEVPTTRPDFYPYSSGITADEFIDGNNVPFDEDILLKYANSLTPDTTRSLERSGYRIGTAVDLTSWMIRTAIDPSSSDAMKKAVFTNWNLDGDRGYGYKTWDGDVPSQPNLFVENESYSTSG